MWGWFKRATLLVFGGGRVALTGYACYPICDLPAASPGSDILNLLCHPNALGAGDPDANRDH